MTHTGTKLEDKTSEWLKNENEKQKAIRKINERKCKPF